MATIQLLHQQANIIPRFLIDDVYFTGILLHGLSDVKMYTYKPLLKWSYYDYWDLINNHDLFLNIYKKAIKILNIMVVDYYKKDFFVIIHMVRDMTKEVNYEFQKKFTDKFTYNHNDKCTNFLLLY